MYNFLCQNGLIFAIQLYKNNKLTIIFPAWNDEFELREDPHSVSYIQDCIE